MDRRAAVHVLDRPAARWCAVAVFLLSAAALAYIHRGDLFGGTQPATVAATDPLGLCMEARRAEIEKMQQEGMLKPDQVERSLGQLEPICRAQLNMEQSSGPPAPPTLPQ
jgi:hypothetical protein